MSIPAIGALDALTPLTGIAPTTGTTAASQPNAQFDNILTSSVEALHAAQGNADTLAVQAVTGDLDDVHDYTIASSQAKVQLELAAAVRNKAVEAFTEIMRMQA